MPLNFSYKPYCNLKHSKRLPFKDSSDPEQNHSKVSTSRTTQIAREKNNVNIVWNQKSHPRNPEGSRGALTLTSELFYFVYFVYFG